jgi:acetyltransferase-like isoleucine patch superfamily enzyme
MCQPGSRRGIIIEPDIWIGVNSVILGGLTRWQGAVIAAGAVVNRNLPAWRC